MRREAEVEGACDSIFFLSSRSSSLLHFFHIHNSFLAGQERMEERERDTELKKLEMNNNSVEGVNKTNSLNL